jgi:ParB-like chromosome segregation protein Spo0J
MTEIVEQATKDLVPYARNPRKNNAVVEQMAASIREFGFKVPILALSDGTIIDGHLRIKAAQKFQIETVPVILCDEWTPAQVKAFRLMANKSVAWAEWDTELLRFEMEDLKSLDFDLDLTGFGEEELAHILEPAGLEGLTDPDSVPELPSNPVTVPGDLWILGNHRLMCGDSRDCSAAKIAFGGRKANICVTSPPYASQQALIWLGQHLKFWA